MVVSENKFYAVIHDQDMVVSTTGNSTLQQATLPSTEVDLGKDVSLL